jgi:Ras homolog gene family, member A
VLHFCSGIPIILVGTFKDLRYAEPKTSDFCRSGQPVSTEEGKALCKKIGAYKYLECSAKTNEGVRDVFECATRAALLRRPKKNKKSRR